MNHSIKNYLFTALLGWLTCQTSAIAADFVGDDEDITVHVAAVAMPSSAYTTPNVLLESTGASRTITVSAADLENDVTITATTGFAVDITTVKAGEEAKVTITNTSYRKKNVGKVIMRSGDYRAYVNLTSQGSDLVQKDITAGKVYDGGTDEAMTFEGFTPSKDGYTVEVRVKVDDASKNFYPFATTDKGVGFKGYVNATSIGLYNGTNSFVSDKALSNPSNGGTFYNTDGEYHTYRYAVTPDERVIVYRDGICIDSLRVADLAPQSDWQESNGEVMENLLKNPGFEGELDFSKSRNIVTRIEGWDVYPYDQYNSTQGVSSSERDNKVDQNNHALWIDRYMWSDGWAAGEVSQIVNVAPNETYSFSCLAKGGIYNGSPLGSVRITDLQNDDNKQTINVTSDSWQTYATDFETKANTKQIRVSFYLERAKWGASVSSLMADDTQLIGVSRDFKQQVGFLNNGAEIDYFAFDNTGAFAPLMASIETSTDSLFFTATGEEQEVTVNYDNLVGDISVSTTSGFTATPAVISKGTGSVTIKVTNDTYRKQNTGKLILRAGDKRTYVQLKSQGSDLVQKDITAGKVYDGGTDEAMTFEGFTPSKDGYTVEVRVKVDDASKNFYPFATTNTGVGFKGYVNATSIGLYNGTNSFVSDKALSNPSNGGTFYNTDGEYHTYRYAVTPDERVIVYRDGICIDSLRVADLAPQSDWQESNGEVMENLLKNPGFEGELDFSKSRNIVTRIEGWDVYPYDQYNSTQGVSSSERDNKVDQNNHALWIDRYMWSDGWAAGEVSQIVNVAPNETYSFSCLAKGGIYNGSPLGSVRITDLQNDDNKQTINVTSDSWQTYATDFETKANTKQIRVSFYLERAKWGASVSSLMADDTQLIGVSRDFKQQVGFLNNGAEIDYFAFDNTGAFAPLMASIETSTDSLFFTATGEEQEVTVNYDNLVGDISVSTTSGFTATPAVISKGTGSVTIKVTNDTYRKQNTGKLILRAGDKRTYVQLKSQGSDLVQKDITAGKVYDGGTDEAMTFEGFTPSKDGYTVEVRVKVDDASKNFYPFATTNTGVGFKGYVNATGIGLYNGTNSFVSDKALSNPSNGGTFYNTDGEYHTYRYAVTPDERVIVYRDGICIDSLRVADLAPQSDWQESNGEVMENLLKNPGFEGELDFSKSRNVITRIEGWDVFPLDQYNSTQGISSSERDNKVDQNNHALWIDRYMWSDGWTAGEVSQIVNVAPNETYSFSCLAKGGIYNGSPLGSVRITDLQNDDNKQTINVTSDSWQTYATDFETKANTKQIRVSFYLERAKWGASVSSLMADDTQLIGVSRNFKQQVGFRNNGAEIDYFAFDNTGAFAPLMASIETSESELSIAGTGSAKSFTVEAANLVGDISVTTTAGFSVYPTTIKADQKTATVTVTNTTYRKMNTGKVILRSGDKRTVVNLISYSSDLEPKDISASPVYEGGTDETMTFEGFNPGENGYTVETRVKVDDASKNFYPFATTDKGVGFKGYVKATGIGLYNGTNSFTSDKALSNPSNGGTFYNTDGEYHTYRYAVTSDERVIVYRDGITIDTLRIADLASQVNWATSNGPVVKNLLKNPGFEGEYDFSKSRNIITRIEGWDVYPYDQYNSTQSIVADERNNKVDQHNHAVRLNRYMWSDGWAAGEISQIVDVAPNEYYRFSCLAKGGMYKESPLGSIRITDLQNDDNKQTINVTSDNYKTYSTEFETKANTKQIRVSLYLERAKWGASVSGLQMDDAKLTGVSRLIQQQIGFENNGAEIDYFTFDNTGAYAPAFPTLQDIDIYTAIEDVNADRELGIKAKIDNGMLTLQGASGAQVAVYSTNGTAHALHPAYTDGTGIALPGKGVYIVLVIDKGMRKSIKVGY